VEPLPRPAVGTGRGVGARDEPEPIVETPWPRCRSRPDGPGRTSRHRPGTVEHTTPWRGGPEPSQFHGPARRRRRRASSTGTPEPGHRSAGRRAGPGRPRTERPRRSRVGWLGPSPRETLDRPPSARTSPQPAPRGREGRRRPVVRPRSPARDDPAIAPAGGAMAIQPRRDSIRPGPRLYRVRAVATGRPRYGHASDRLP